MSGYRNYVPWNKPSTYSGTLKKDTPGGIPRYDTSFGRSRTETSSSSRIASKYGGAYSAGYQRDSAASRDAGYAGRSDSSRIKPVLDKKDTSHPPVTYRPITRTGARSRDPSPVEKSEKSSSSSSSYNYNRLYPRPYQRSVSRETTDSTSSPSIIPKYTGRTSVGRDEIPKYAGRSSLSKDDVPKYMGRSSVSSRSSREDLSSGSQKYINSRFLPKNSVEKSYTAYTRPSTARTNETSRKNRELLSVLHAQQEQERLSRPSSRCSSVAPEDSVKEHFHVNTNSEPPPKQIEMETITVVTRGTSPTQTAQNTSYLRSRRVEIAKVIEKQITRPKRRTHTMIDKEIQSDRLDDSTKTSRFAGASRITATPWSSFLDMKFSSPNAKQKTLNKSDNSSQEEDKRKDICDSPKSISRTSSTKSLNQTSTKSDKPKEAKKSPSPSKSRIVPPKQISSDKKQLPPQIPKGENAPKSNSLHSLLPTNKDFRKSVLNMNPDGTAKKKIGRRSNSASSADSDAADADATDVSENLTSCKSYHNTSSSKLPQKVPSDKSLQRNRRSPSSDASTSSHTTSSSEDDPKTKQEKTKLQSAGSSRTSIVISSADELPSDKSPKPPQSPRQKGDGVKSEAEAKSFLMRALAPVTNLFKNKHHDSTEKVNWMDPSSESGSCKNKTSPPSTASIAASNTPSNELIPAKIIIHRVEPDDNSWWLQETPETSTQDQDNSQKSNSPQAPLQKPFMKHVDSGEIPWWLDESAEVPEGVQTYPNWVREDGTTEDGRVIYKIRKNDSGNSSWWVSSSEKTNTDSSKNQQSNIMDSEYLAQHKIRHIDSGERAWWLNSSENIAGMVQAKEETKQIQPKFAIRHQDSDEKPWWLQHKDSDNESDHEQIPLGDRASPEGLEMPKDDEGRRSPYDNVPSIQHRAKRPTQLPLFISRHTNIDEILGGSTQIWSPLMDKIYGYEKNKMEECMEIDPTQVIIHDGTSQRTFVQQNRTDNTGFPKTFTSHGKDVCLEMTPRSQKCPGIASAPDQPPS